MGQARRFRINLKSDTKTVAYHGAGSGPHVGCLGASEARRRREASPTRPTRRRLAQTGGKSTPRFSGERTLTSAIPLALRKAREGGKDPLVSLCVALGSIFPVLSPTGGKRVGVRAPGRAVTSLWGARTWCRIGKSDIGCAVYIPLAPLGVQGGRVGGSWERQLHGSCPDGVTGGLCSVRKAECGSPP